VTRSHPDRVGESFSFELSDNPHVYIDSGKEGSLVTFINEDVLSPNCVAVTMVHRGLLRIRVSTTSDLEADETAGWPSLYAVPIGTHF
jgi:hypothetical protein